MIFKNATYMVIIFVFLNMAMPSEKNNRFIRYIAGLVVVLTLMSPLVNLLSSISVEDMIKDIYEYDQSNVLTPDQAKKLIEENDEKAMNEVGEIVGGEEKQE